MKKHYIIFNGPISIETVNSIINKLINILTDNPSEIYIAFTTNGGNVAQGILLFNFLKSIQCKLTIHNIGNINSAGIPVFLASKNRLANKSSRFLFHGVYYQSKSGFSKDLKEALDTVTDDQDKINEIILKYTKIKETEIDELSEREYKFSSSMAKEKGIVDNISEFKLPQNSIIHTLLFNGN